MFDLCYPFGTERTRIAKSPRGRTFSCSRQSDPTKTTSLYRTTVEMCKVKMRFVVSDFVYLWVFFALFVI